MATEKKGKEDSEVMKKWKPYILERPVEETVLYEKVAPHIAKLTLNRPEVHNAFYYMDMQYEFDKKLKMGITDSEVKVIIITGAGRSFCSGDDLHRAPYEAFGGKPGEKLPQSNRLIGFWQLYESFRMLLYCPKFTIASVRGAAIGVGLWIAEFCDITIAGESAIFSEAEQRIGFAGFGINPLRMLEVGPKRATEWALTGKELSAQEAKEWGVVNKVVPDDKLEEETMNWAKMISLHSTDGLVNSKIYKQIALDAAGCGPSLMPLAVSHTLFTNLVWREDELNFLKLRTLVGTTEAFKKREAMWAELGF